MSFLSNTDNLPDAADNYKGSDPVLLVNYLTRFRFSSKVRTCLTLYVLSIGQIMFQPSGSTCPQVGQIG